MYVYNTRIPFLLLCIWKRMGYEVDPKLFAYDIALYFWFWHKNVRFVSPFSYLTMFECLTSMYRQLSRRQEHVDFSTWPKVTPWPERGLVNSSIKMVYSHFQKWEEDNGLVSPVRITFYSLVCVQFSHFVFLDKSINAWRRVSGIGSKW